MVLQAYIRSLSPKARYKRFLGALNELSPTKLDRAIHLNQKYQLALLAETRVGGMPVVVGEGRYAQQPDGLAGDFALSVANG